MNRMRGDNKGSREDGSAVGVGGHSNGFAGSGDVDGGQDTKVNIRQITFSFLMRLFNTDGWSGEQVQDVTGTWSHPGKKLKLVISSKSLILYSIGLIKRVLL